MNEWSNRKGEIEDADDKHVAAMLAAALLARGFDMPAASNTTMAAAQAVESVDTVPLKSRLPCGGTSAVGRQSLRA